MSLRAWITCLGAIACLAACQSTPPLSDGRRVDSSEEVGNIYVSAYPAIPWSAVAAKLEPKNNLTTAEARAMAAVTTQSQVSQFLSTFAAGLAVGLPNRSSLTTTTLAADGTTTTTGTRTRGTGTVPAASGVRDATVSDASLQADLSKAVPTLGIDASTQLTVGSAIYQLAQILDNQISQAITPKGYQAHLLTFQINLQPAGRNLPYDAYVNVTLMPADWDMSSRFSKQIASDSAALAPVIVYPLVISDAMESSSVARSVEIMRQAALALSGVIGNVGVNAGLQGASDNLQSLLGSDRNSLVTVGRISEHSIRIRLGAQYQGSRRLALVPRTHNVSVVVFTREDLQVRANDIERLSVITKTSFVDADLGTVPESRRNSDSGQEDILTRVQAALASYGFRLKPECAPRTRALDMLRSLDRSDFTDYEKCLEDLDVRAGSDPENHKALRQVRLKRVVAELMTVQTNSRYSKLLVQLSDWDARKPSLPTNGQLALLSDDGSSSRMTLRGGANLDSRKLVSKLRVSSNGKHYDLLPTGIDVDGAGKAVTLVFPSIAGSQLMASMADPAKKGAMLTVDPDLELSLGWSGENCKCRLPDYPVKLIRSAPKPAGNPVIVTSGVLVPDSAGVARLSLMVGPSKTEAGTLAVRVSGADLRGIEPASDVDFERGAIIVKPASRVTLLLGNLSSARPVQLTTLSKTDTLGSPITLTVQTAGLDTAR